MQNFIFYLRHALNNMNRNRQRTLFVLFCIAAGVSAVVSLRTLGLMIGDAILENLQADLRGDMVVSAPSSFSTNAREMTLDTELVNDGGMFQSATFTDQGLAEITAWANERGYEIAPAQMDGAPLQARRAENAERAETLTLFFVDEDNYPFYRVLDIVEPFGTTLSAAFQEPTDIAIAVGLADKLGVAVGDQVRLTGAREAFTVRALVSDTTEASLTNPSTLLLPFAYLSFQAGQELFNRQADTIYFRLPPDADILAAEEAFETDFPGMRARTTDDLEAVNEEVTDLLTDLITTTGLVSLLIGGIGIINTMLVVVRRRALEIGVLKTIGLQGRQITLMFILEALMLGVMGSSLGVLFGLGLTRLLQQVGERLASRSLTFAVYPEAVIMGLVTGTVVTLVFGFLPTLSAGRVRPNIVLNPSADNPVPAAARWQSALVILGMTLVIGLLVGQIIENYLIGIAATIGVFVLVGLTALLMWVIILLMTMLPSFGSIRLKLSQRAIGTHRGRTASTLLALVVGMFALSFILLFTQSIISLLNLSLDEQLGGNILAIGQTYPVIEDIRETAEALPGVRSVSFQEMYQGDIVAINGDRDMDALTAAARERALAERSADDEEPPSEEQLQNRRIGVNFELQFFLDSFILSPLTDDTLYSVDDGRDLSDQSGELVLQTSDATQWLGIDLGDSITLRFDDGEEIDLTLVGTMEPFNISDIIELQGATSAPSSAVISPGTVSDDINPMPGPIIIDADEATLNETILAVSEIPGAIVFEAGLIQSFVTTILEQLTALPLVVAILSLFASSVIIANTVSLATLERRREIGIMKAIGLQSNQVLSLLLLENGLLGFLGGILGTSVGTAVSLLTLLADRSGSGEFPFMTLVWLVLLATGIALGATLITAIGAAREKPLIVLRYE